MVLSSCLLGWGVLISNATNPLCLWFARSCCCLSLGWLGVCVRSELGQGKNITVNQSEAVQGGLSLAILWKHLNHWLRQAVRWCGGCFLCTLGAPYFHSFMTTVHPSCHGCFQQDNAISSPHLKMVSWTWQCVPCTHMASSVTTSQSSRAALEYGGTADSYCGSPAEKSAVTVRCYHVNMEQKLWEMLLAPCWTCATKNIRASASDCWFW